MNVLSLKFSQVDAAAAAGVTGKAIQNWITRGYLIGHNGIEGGGTRGRNRTFTFHSMMEIAVMKCLIDTGMGDLAKVANAAGSFAHFGGSGTPFNLPDRLPGLPFHHNHGRTIFAVGGGRTFETLDTPDHNVFADVAHHIGTRNLITIDASETFDNVCGRIGVHPLKALDAEYPEEAR